MNQEEDRNIEVLERRKVRKQHTKPENQEERKLTNNIHYHRTKPRSNLIYRSQQSLETPNNRT